MTVYVVCVCVFVYLCVWLLLGIGQMVQFDVFQGSLVQCVRVFEMRVRVWVTVCGGVTVYVLRVPVHLFAFLIWSDGSVSPHFKAVWFSAFVCLKCLYVCGCLCV